MNYRQAQIRNLERVRAHNTMEADRAKRTRSQKRFNVTINLLALSAVGVVVALGSVMVANISAVLIATLTK